MASPALERHRQEEPGQDRAAAKREEIAEADFEPMRAQAPGRPAMLEHPRPRDSDAGPARPDQAALDLRQSRLTATARAVRVETWALPLLEVRSQSDHTQGKDPTLRRDTPAP
ncbi:MAG TPA: hypothetical protein DIT64_17020 [Verrucomicrobiales bacterium]|nr:hypothetical protein [Verrucomicrobiales bacterium]